jgi:AcrR family transcriptional regulator
VADTRAQILAAAQALFTEQGFDKASLREVAEKVGVTKAALYYHFPSKEALLSALLAPLAEAAGEILGALRSDQEADWALGLEAFIEWMMRNRDLFDLIEHNEAAITALSATGSDFAEMHQGFHDTIDAALGDPKIPLERRVRLMCALGVSIALAHFGRPFDVDADFEDIRFGTVNAMRATLGLGARRRASKTP